MRNTFYAAFGAALSLSLATGAAAADEVNLVYGSFLPEGHLIHKAGLEPFFERVAADSGNTVKFELVPGGVMGGPREALQIVRDGVVDGSLIVDVYLKSDFPVASMLGGLLAVPDDPLVFISAANEFLLLKCPECKAELEKHGLVAFAHYGTSPYYFMCRDQVSDLSDLEGKKIRSASRLGALASHMGGTSVSVSVSEMYEALQRGQADCALAAASWLKDYNLKDVIGSLVDKPFGSYFTPMLFNLSASKWEALSAEQKAAVIKNLPSLLATTTFEYLAQSDAAIADGREGGMSVNPATDEFVARLEEFQKGERSYAISAGLEAGVENAEKIVTEFFDTVEKWRGIVAETQSNREAYEQALWSEIFSKL